MINKDHKLIGQTATTQDGMALGVISDVLVAQGLVWFAAIDMTYPISAIKIVDTAVLSKDELF